MNNFTVYYLVCNRDNAEYFFRKTRVFGISTILKNTFKIIQLQTQYCKPVRGGGHNAKGRQ